MTIARRGLKAKVKIKVMCQANAVGKNSASLSYTGDLDGSMNQRAFKSAVSLEAQATAEKNWTPHKNVH